MKRCQQCDIATILQREVNLASKGLWRKRTAVVSIGSLLLWYSQRSCECGRMALFGHARCRAWLARRSRVPRRVQCELAMQHGMAEGRIKAVLDRARPDASAMVR
jgi:hypothetical protein